LGNSDDKKIHLKMALKALDSGVLSGRAAKNQKTQGEPWAKFSCPFGARSAPLRFAGAGLSIRAPPPVRRKSLLLDRFGNGSFAFEIIRTAAAFFDFVVLLTHSTPVTGIIHSVN
jgi:hypothetical protein